MDSGWAWFWAIYFLLCAAVSDAAKKKGRGTGAWFFIAFCITPILAGFFVAFMSNNQEAKK